VLLLNRRGFSAVVLCQDCGTPVQCDHCHVSLTLHKGKKRLICHYCGFSTRDNTVCLQCRSPYLVPAGFGTERVEEEVAASGQCVVPADEGDDGVGHLMSYDLFGKAIRGYKYGIKAVRLCRLIELGLPVPPGFVISARDTEEKVVFSIEELRLALIELEEITGKKLGDFNNLLSLSARSSPEKSMPGLLATELDITTENELILAISAVMNSWNNLEAELYRKLHNMPNLQGISVIAQVMVFGDLNQNMIEFTKYDIDAGQEIVPAA